MSKTAVLSFAVALALPFVVACRIDPGYSRDTLKVKRVDTVPAQATLLLVDSNREWITPCDIAENVDFDIDDAIIVRKAGYATFEGTLEEGAAQIASGTYQIRLKKLD